MAGKKPMDDQVILISISARSIHFGVALRHLRQTHNVPCENEEPSPFAKTQTDSGSPPICSLLAAHYYSIGVEIYREIEDGTRLPEDPILFLDAFAEGLALSDTEVSELVWLLGYEILRGQLGEEIALELYLDLTQSDHIMNMLWI